MASKLLFSISDSEIFDAYMSAPSHFNEKLLLEEGRSRSILYSKHEDCESLALKLSRQVYGYKELQPIESYFSQIGRTDKTAALQIDAPLTQAELKSIADDFAANAEPNEEVTSFLDGPNLVVNTVYTITDFSRNRLRQRQEKEALVKFEIGPQSTTVTMPATLKGREIAAALRKRIEQKRNSELPVQEVDLSDILDPARRTQFFTMLVSDFPNATLNDVLRVKLQGSSLSSASELADEDDDDDEAEIGVGLTRTEEIVAGVLRGATLNGQDLFGTRVFQQLRQRGFFISSITWRSRLQEASSPIVEFSAEFEDVEECKSFRYSANTWQIRRSTGEYNGSFTPIPPVKKAELLRSLQNFAMSTLQQIRTLGQETPEISNADGGDGEPS